MTSPFLDCTAPVTSFREIVARLDQIIEVAYQQHSRIGYFPALYRHVAAAFVRAAEQQLFTYPRLIEQLDVSFFNRYLEALRRYHTSTGPSLPWQSAFDATKSAELTVIQHLLIGMNAHMAYDLALAIAETCPGDQLPQLQGDFLTMNNVVGSLIGDIRRDLTTIWPLISLWERLLGADENSMVDLSMRAARANAWRFAVEQSTLSADARYFQIAALASEVAARSRMLAKPPFPINLVGGAVRFGELTTVQQTIEILMHRQLVPKGARLPIAQSRKRRKKVAILGGGVGALTTAFALTDPDNPHADEYDITVYQLGWRLGGKGASGRDPDNYDRIEEHGLHIWFGCYDNAFRTIRKCYAELNRPPDAPLATWWDAFTPHSVFVMEEHINDQWLNWLAGMPLNDLTPGDGSTFLAPWQYIAMAVNLMGRIFAASPVARPSATGNNYVQVPAPLHGFLDQIAGALTTDAIELGLKLLRLPHHVAHGTDQTTDMIAAILQLSPGDTLKWLGTLFERLTDPLADALHELNYTLVMAILDRFMQWLWDRVGGTLATNSDHRHLWIYLSFLYANIRGGLHEDVLRRGFDCLNEYDYREWLAKHAFDDNGVMLNSVVMLSIYDAMFAYEGGDNTSPHGAAFPPKARLEAGTAMRCGLRQFLMFKGAGAWKMQAGMGDTVFAPLYEVLKRRGVKFKFFHRVQQLCLSEDKRIVERIEISRQVTIKDEQEAKGGYAPLYNVKGLPCWPNRPWYDQIVEGEDLKASGTNLEDYLAPWNNANDYTLRAGQDFDIVVLGISLGALPYICGDLIEASKRWKNMVDHVKTIRTQGFQLWLKPTAYELGWMPMERPIGGGYDVDAIDSWADMSHLIAREGWPTSSYPQQLVYYCGAMKDDIPLHATKHGPMPDQIALDQRRANDSVKATAIGLLKNSVLPTMPNAYVFEKNGTKRFRWDLLIDSRLDQQAGEARFEAQYWHANVQPSERYVLSAPGSTKYRLPAHDPDEFTNLYLAGDWTNNGFNIGCVEAATMSGLLASNAISEYPARELITGVDL
jgi:uncharacterized protein with NAD-binding domain and iron-sulfur cluster